ncbi:hypothetical protein [Piscinibacter gummiphilus]|nr:hypothetical protein [Piscinibacter gummiphilus]
MPATLALLDTSAPAAGRAVVATGPLPRTTRPPRRQGLAAHP